MRRVEEIRDVGEVAEIRGNEGRRSREGKLVEGT